MNLQGTQKPASSHEGDAPVGYSGSALCSGDFDDDGVADLVTGLWGGVGVDHLDHPDPVARSYLW